MSKSERDIPLDGEINPNHPMTKFAREQWHKIAALLMMELGKDSIEITEAMIARIGSDRAIALDERGGKLFVRLVSIKEAERLAREAGGLPA